MALHKQHPSTQAKCTLCDEGNDTDDHLCFCTDPTAIQIRTGALKSLNDALIDSATDPCLRFILHSGINAWFLTCDNHFSPEVPPDHPCAALLEQAVAEQTAIGWSQICRGRISTTWGDCYNKWLSYLHNPPGTTKLDPLTWTTRIIRWAWETIHHNNSNNNNNNNCSSDSYQENKSASS